MGDGVGRLGEHRCGLGQQAAAGERATLDAARRAAHGRVRVAGVAGGAIGGGSRVGLCSVRAGRQIGGRLRRVRCGRSSPSGVGYDAGTPVLVEGARRDAELACAGAAAHPGGEQIDRLVGHLGVDDGTSTPPARREEGIFAAVSIAFDGARDGGTREVEGPHDVGLADAGNDVQPGGAQQQGATVLGGVAIEGVRG